ncbi:unnamed protein product [Linum tenue]|nr:unnamed protein product [Linum tenue]
MPFGEMSILIHDVHYILRLPVDGALLRYDSPQPEALKADMCGLIRVGDLEGAVGGKWSTIWYMNGGMHGEGALFRAGELQIKEVEVQCYLFLLLGSTLFVDKSRDRIRPAVNLYLKKYHDVAGYAWGVGTLAYLYRQLGVASRAGGKGVCGYLTLLQAWIYEYFPDFRPNRVQQHSPADPRASLWVCSRLKGRDDAKERLVRYRSILDGMSADDVTWTPYGGHAGVEVMRSLYNGVIRFADVAEGYDPSRCLRQYGYRQAIPRPMMIPDDHFRPASAKDYNVTWFPGYDQFWTMWESNRWAFDAFFTPCERPSDVDEGFMDWYRAHSHPLITSPSVTRQIPRELVSCFTL